MGSKCRSVSAIIILAAILIATGVCVFASTWSTYHYDHRRIGVTTQENLDAGNLKLIWTFPRYDNFGTGMISDAVVDVPSSPNNGWELTGNWSGRGSLPNPPSDYYGNDFRYAVTVNYPHEPTATAIWRLPAGSPVGSYSIQVYFPSSGSDKTNASNARYTVHHANGAITYKIDQRDGGGWITLGTGTFTLDADSYVELTNVIDRDPNDRTEYIVCADAVRFIPQLDMEIYSSPTAADLTDPTNPTSSIPFVWIGTVEGPMASGAPDTDDSDEFGAVYCVYSYNDNDITTTDPENDDSFWNNYKVQSVGTAKWRYPAGGRFDASGKTPNNRSPLEGPIGRLGNGMGGVFSAPTYIPERNLVVFGGMDGQVYCVRATNGELVWKGPGVTIPEEGNASGLWNERDNRFDAFGGSFLYAPCTTDTGGAAKIEYNILGTSSDPGTDANRGENGHMYAIYAWMPARDPATEVDGNGNPILRSRDATYTITFDGTQTRTIRIDQRDSTDPNIGSGMSSNPNAGKWVRLGSSYWNPRKVTLTTETQIASQINEELGNGDTITRVVVADAIMVVPEDIGPFSYSTPVYDGVNSVYIGNTNGRVYSLNIANGRLNWTYPKVQTKRSISMSNPQDAAASPFGSIVSSPALNFYGSSTGIGSRKLVVSSMDGKVYCLSNLSAGENGVELEWQYSAASRWGTGAQNEQELFSASPVIDGNEVYVPSTGGRMHAIDLQDGNCLWVSPDSADNSVPLSPFRYSTPAVYDNRVVCGSTGGMVYRFDPNNGQIDETLDVRLYSPIQGAIAVDGNHMYISTMDGSIWWVDRNTGNAPANGRAGYTNLGQLFSSPAVANTYVYVGSGNGRLYAFSDEAFGGMWVGGGKEGYRDVPATEQDAASVNPSELSQVDIFSPQVWHATRAAFEELATLGGTATSDIQSALASTTVDKNLLFVDNSFDGKTPMNGHKRADGMPLSSGERQLYIEWGEIIYLIAWNLPELKELDSTTLATNDGVGSQAARNAVRFRFNNAGAGSGAGGTMDEKQADCVFEYKFTDADGLEKRKCVAMAMVDTIGRSSPPAPGTGWIASLRVTTSSGGSGTGTGRTTVAQPIVTVPILTGTSSAWTVKNPTGAWEDQSIGINNPLAIMDDGLLPRKDGRPTQGTSTSLGWPGLAAAGGTLPTNKYGTDPTIHCNGNAYDNGGTWQVVMPHVYLGWGPHGANSRVAPLWIMDRSATGLRVAYRKQSELTNFMVTTSDLQWQGGNGAVVNPLPWDYPPYHNFGIYNSRMQRDYPDITRRALRFQKTSDYSDPSTAKTTLLPAIPDNQETPNYEFSRLQPDSLEIWAEIPQFQPANTSGPGYSAELVAFLDTSPSDGSFNSGNVIAGRPTSYVEAHRRFRLSVCVPPDYHMVVEKPLTMDIIGPDKAPAPHGLGLYLNPASLTDWWKSFTVKNYGNVNLTNLKVAKRTTNGPLDLFSEDVDRSYPISMLNLTDVSTGIISSLDGWDPHWGAINAEPFATSGHGFTLSKARVGDVAPLELTIPDKRKISEYGPSIVEAIVNKTGDPSKSDPIEPSLSVIVPLTQPSGSYWQLVPVYADLNGNDRLDYGVEPFTEPSFRVNVVVAEDRLTGGATPGSAIQIDPVDPEADPTTPKPLDGDTQPAAWRDPYDGNTYLFWSSNRTGDPTASQRPWYLLRSALGYHPPKNGNMRIYDWAPADPSLPYPRWWENPSTNRIPAFDWMDMTDVDVNSIRHSSPFVALNLDSPTDARIRTWLFWQGQADVLDIVNNRMKRDYRILYTPATGGNVTSTDQPIYNFARDTSLIKMNPRAIAYFNGSDENIWLLWHGGDAGRWSIYGNLNTSPANDHNENAWSPDIRFSTPTCLVSVSDPSPVHRRIAGSDAFMDLAYVGASKHGQESDIIFTRYKWTGSWDSNLRVNPVPLPRIYNEELERDPKYNVYSSGHLAWLRPPTGGTIDNWGSPSEDPYIRVVLVDDYTTDGTTFAAGTIISATDGSIRAQDGSIIRESAAIAPEVDRATGIYTYSYEDDVEKLLGQMIVDYSAGIVRFTNPLPPKTKVFAEYTPQAIRLTRGPEQDSAPFMFIEKTELEFKDTGTCLNPGVVKPTSSYNGAMPIDRLWLFWRKPSSSGVQASSIYYKTYRIGINLPKAVKMTRDGRPEQVTISGIKGVAEVSWDGKRIFFSSVDERYPGLPGTAGPINIKYKALDGQDIDITVDTVTWMEELPETALPTRLRVNEGQVCAFVDPCVRPTKVWVFWSSTRAGKSDLYYQTISPNFRGILF